MAWGSVNAPGGGSAISQAGPPNAEIPAQPGQHYYDSAGQKEYVCRGKDDEGRYVWELAGATDAADLTYRGLPLTEALDGLGGFWFIRDNIPPNERRSGVLYGLILQNWEG